MAKARLKLDIEEKLAEDVDRKDLEATKGVADKLPAEAKAKFYKRTEDGTKLYIHTMLSEDLHGMDMHEYIKSKFHDKFGGGDYVIEFTDSGGDVVRKNTISIMDEKKDTADAKFMDVAKEALKVKEDAIDKTIKVEEKIREAEKIKYETALDTLNKSWELMRTMFEARIKELEERQKTAPENLQVVFQMQIDSLRRELDREKERIEREVKIKEEAKTTMDKVIESFLPILVTKATEDKDYIDKFAAIYKTIESVQERNKDFFTTILENPERALTFKRLMGIDERKDFLMEMIENPQRFDMFKKLMGIEEKETVPVPVEPKKDFLENLIDFTSKLSNAKPVLMNLLGVQPQPVKSFLELISVIMQNAGPYISQSVKQVTDSMVTMELIKKGLIKTVPEGVKEQLAAFSGIEPTVEKVEKPEPKKPTPTKPPTNDVIGIFKEILIDVAASTTEEMETKIFVDKVADIIVKRARENPSLIREVMKQNTPELKLKAVDIVSKVLNINEFQAIAVANAIFEAVKNKVNII